MATLNIRKEILQLISVNEKIQSGLLMGESLHEDEREIVGNCAKELLEASSISPQKVTTRVNESQNQGCKSS